MLYIGDVVEILWKFGHEGEDSCWVKNPDTLECRFVRKVGEWEIGMSPSDGEDRTCDFFWARRAGRDEVRIDDRGWLYSWLQNEIPTTVKLNYYRVDRGVLVYCHALIRKGQKCFRIEQLPKSIYLEIQWERLPGGDSYRGLSGKHSSFDPWVVELFQRLKADFLPAVIPDMCDKPYRNAVIEVSIENVLPIIDYFLSSDMEAEGKAVVARILPTSCKI